MDRIIISDTGFPFDNETLRRLQSGYKGPIEAIVRALGEDLILDGVIDDGTTISSGWIVWEGEILPFEAGASSSVFEVVQVDTSLFYDNNSTSQLPAYERRFARPLNVAQGSYDTLFQNLKRIGSLASNITTSVIGRCQTSTENGETFYGNIVNFTKLTDSFLGDYFRVDIPNQVNPYVPIVVNSAGGNQDAYVDFTINNINNNYFEIWPNIPEGGSLYANYNIQIIN